MTLYMCLESDEYVNSNVWMNVHEIEKEYYINYMGSIF